MTTSKSTILREGLVAGLLGYASVALLFIVLNVSQGLSPVHTPEVLGSTLLQGFMDPVGPWAAVLAFNGLHLGVTLALGVGAALLAYRAEMDHALAMGLVFFLLALGGFVPIFFGAVTVEFLHALRWPEVVAGSVVGAVGTLGYLAWAHRGLVVDLFREAEA